jgi:protein involved in polysaccharide export with SLBB domain
LTTPEESGSAAADDRATTSVPSASVLELRQAGVSDNDGGSAASTPAPTATSPAQAQAQDQDQAQNRSRTSKPLTAKTEFQRFAEDATGRLLPVYGRKLFDQAPTTFAPVERVPVPVNYVLGPGDELLIRVWGKINLDAKVTVDRNGQINLPKVGTLSVAGLHYDQIQGYLHTAIANLYKDFELNVTLGQLRSIEVYVVGSARQPGAYTVSSLSTLVNALFASGGPSATGSMRHIQLRRGDKLVSEFDLYDLLQKGDKSHDVQLLPGDVIFIPAVGAQVAISGNINEPGIYELKAETTVRAALEGAGGLTGLAGTQRVLLERIDNHSSRKVEEFSLDASGLQRQLKDGDLLRVYPISPKFENAVTLQGSVAEPGRYVWKEGMRVSDLIPSRDFLVTRDHWNRQNYSTPTDANHQFGISRRNYPENIGTDQPRNLRADEPATSDTDQENLRTDQLGAQRTDQLGALRTDQLSAQRPDQFGAERTDIADTVGTNSAEINWEYAVIERLDDRDLSTQLIPFRLASAIDNPASSDNQVLKAGDILTIFSRANLELPMDKHSAFVRLSGEVKAPGIYRVEPGETLREVVVQAGGLTPHSYLYASKLTRVSTRLAQEEQLKKYTEQMQKELLAQNLSASPASSQSAADKQAELAQQQAAIANISAVRPTGRIVLKMKPTAATVEDIPNFGLEDGDAFYVPSPQNTVEVTGAVYNESAYRYEQGKRALAYLNDAGGPTRNADKKRAFVIRADGSVVSKQSHNAYTHGSFDKMALLPGDALVVPTKMKSGFNLQAISNMAQLASSAAVTAATVSILK